MSKFEEPNKVTDPFLDSTSDTLIVTWTPPSDGEFTGYRVRISPSDAKKSKLDIKDVNQTRAEFTGLTPNKKYKVSIMTMSGQTESEKVSLQEKTSKLTSFRYMFCDLAGSVGSQEH